jgi:PAS domain S-box-containing protein
MRHSHPAGLYRYLPQALALFPIVIASLAFAGWLFDLEMLKSMLPGLTAMKANTALAIFLSGITLWITLSGNQAGRIASRLGAGVVLLIGMLVLWQYISDVSIGIDQALFMDATNVPGDIPGRMAVTTALSLVALGIALLLLGKQTMTRTIFIHGLCLVPLLASTTALIGYAFGINQLIRVQLNFTPMAINTALALWSLAFGVIHARPDFPLPHLLNSDSSTGRSLRQLLPMSVALMVLSGWLVNLGLHAGYFTELAGLALFTAINITGMSTLILVNLVMLEDTNAKLKDANRAVLETQQLMETIVNNLPLAILLKSTLDLKFVLVNPNAEDILGFERKDMLGKNVHDLYPADQADFFESKDREVISKATMVDISEEYNQTKNNELRVLHTRKILINSSDGAHQYIMGVSEDITERKKAEDDLKSAALYSRSLLEASVDPLVTISPEGKVTDVNRATESATGRSREELVGTDFSAYFTDPDKAREGYQAVFSKGFVTDYPLGMLHRDGHVTDVLYNASLYRNASGEVAGVFAAARDVTEKMKAEDELNEYRAHLVELVDERTRSLEEANRELESFAYSVSHDLRVPLRAIDGFSLQLLNHHDDHLDSEGKRYLTIVRDNTRKMAQLIDDILAFSRMGRLEMAESVVDMKKLAGKVIEELQPEISGRHIAIEIKPLPPCRGDQSMMHQVWMNLLNNAVKFTRPREAAQIEVGAGKEGAEMIYYVRDNGAGFDMRYADKLFGVFQRLHGVEEFEGTGIGLAIVKRVIARHGGRVWAEGKVDAGATFYFSLPFKEKKHDLER